MTRLRALTSDTFRSLRSRNFRLFFSGQLISQVGNWSTMIVQTLMVLHLTNNGFALGLLAAAQFGPVLLLGPWAGLVADRSDKRRLLLAVQSAAMAQSFVLAAIGFQAHPPLVAIYLAAIAGGFATAFDNPARRAFVVEMVPEQDIANAVSLNSALMTGARVIGPALGGLLATTVGYGWAFALDGISYLAVLAGLAMMNSAALRPAPAARRGRGQVREGLRYVRAVPELWLSLTLMAVIGTLAFNFQTTLPLLTTRDLHGDDRLFTLLMAVVSLGSLLGALGTARRRSVGLGAVSRSALAFGVALGLLALAPNPPVAFAVGMVVGVSSISFMTASTALVQLRADPVMRGRVLALQSVVFLGSTPIGGPIVGFVAEHLNARYSIGVGALATVVAGGLSHLRTRRGVPTGAPVEPAAPLVAGSDPVPGAARPAVATTATATVMVGAGHRLPDTGREGGGTR